MPDQGADDTHILSSSGATAAATSVPLIGEAASAAAGDLGITGDVFQILAGAEMVAAPGAITFERAFSLTGQGAAAWQHPVGAPGYADLIGAQTLAIAGTVYLTNDRDYQLVGEAMTAAAGDAFASSLAFPQGAELASGLGILGDQEQAITGSEATAEAGSMVPQIDQPQFVQEVRTDEGGGGRRGGSQMSPLRPTWAKPLVEDHDAANAQIIEAIVSMVVAGEL